MLTTIAMAEQRAHEVLKTNRVAAPPVDVEAIAKAHGALVRLEELEADVSGLLIVRSTSAKPVIAVNRSHHENRRRFTIAHEMGHLLLHSKDPQVFVDGMLVHFREDSNSSPASPKELQANSFAAALLMPADFLRRDLRGHAIDADDEDAVKALAQKYKVSPQALTIRLVRLGLFQGMAT
jgi:Zn-dependent peptidase ImmA (M78 family)